MKMENNKKLVNTLIKRKGLMEELKKRGINRVSREGEDALNLFFLDYFEKTFLGLKEEMEVSGKRVLDKWVVQGFIEEKNKEEEIDY